MPQVITNMPQVITIKSEDIVDQVKLSCQIPQIIEGIITRKIIETAIAEAEIKIETEEVQKAADAMRSKNRMGNPDETYAWLEKHSLSLEDFTELVYINLSRSKLAHHLFADQVEPYFFSHQLDYEGAVIYEVILNDEDLAIELFCALSEGESSFSDIAHQYIQDRELSRRGGYRGVVRRKEMKPEISAAVFAANPPQILKPIITAKGVHLILVEEIIRAQLDDKLRSEIISYLFRSWLQKKIEEVKIDLVLSDGQALGQYIS